MRIHKKGFERVVGLLILLAAVAMVMVLIRFGSNIWVQILAGCLIMLTILGALKEQ